MKANLSLLNHLKPAKIFLKVLLILWFYRIKKEVELFQPLKKNAVAPLGIEPRSSV
jgi:hypothetical protein